MRAIFGVTLLMTFCTFQAQAQTCSNSSLNGTYFYQAGGAIAATGGTFSFVELGKLIADGNGGVSGQATVSVGGTVGTFSLAGSYTVQGNCTGAMLVSVNSQAPETLTFQVVNGGFDALVAFSSSGEVATGRIYRAASAGHCSDASLTGGYGYVDSGAEGAFLYSAAGQATFSGTGALTSFSLTNTGTGASQSSSTGSYFVASDCSGNAQLTAGSSTAHFNIAVVEGGAVLFMVSDSGATVIGTAQPQLIQSILPDFIAGGGWFSAIYFANTTANTVSFPVAFIGDDGNPMTVPSVGGSSTTVTLAPNSSTSIQTTNVGSLIQGYVSVALPAGVTGYGVFDFAGPGVSSQEAVVPLSSASATSSTLVFDDTNFLTAVALVNPSAVATSVNITLRGSGGATLGTSVVALGPKSKVAVILRTLPGLAGIVGNQGTAEFTVSNGNLVVMGIRYNGGAYTSIPTTQQ
jgi:hypothetical protein